MIAAVAIQSLGSAMRSGHPARRSASDLSRETSRLSDLGGTPDENREPEPRFGWDAGHYVLNGLHLSNYLLELFIHLGSYGIES